MNAHEHPDTDPAAQPGSGGAGRGRGYDERLLREQLLALNRQGRVSNAIPPINAVIATVLLWGAVPTATLLGWVAVVWAVAAARLWFYGRFDRAMAEGEVDGEVWRKFCVAVYAVAGASWGVGSVVVFPPDNILLQAFLIIFVLGTAAGATASLAPYFPAMVAYILPLVMPVSIHVYFMESPSHSILGATGVVFLTALVLMGRAGNRNFTESVRLGIINEGLVDGLERTQRRLEDALDSIEEAFALFDRGDRLVEFNENFRTLVPELARTMTVGLEYDRFARALCESAFASRPETTVEEWHGEIARRHRGGEMPIELRMSDGRWVSLNERRTKDGGTVSLLSDITDLKRRESEIAVSEQRFRDFTAAASDWAWETDSQGRFRSVSGRYTEVSGRPTDFLIGRSLLEMAADEPDGEWRQLVGAVQSHRPFRNIHVVRRDRHERPFHFLMSAVPIFDEEGVFAGYRGTGSDISAMIAAETRAREAQTRLFEAIESFPASFVLFDESDRLILWNSRAPEYFPGATRLMVSGTSYTEIMGACARSGAIPEAEDDPDAWVEGAVAWLRHPERRREVSFADGRHVNVLGRRTADGSVVCVLTDITDIRLGQEELAEKTSQLQATLEGMGEGLIVVDRHLRVTLSNSRLRRLSGLPEEAVAPGVPFADILDRLDEGADIEVEGDTADAAVGVLFDHFGTGLPFRFEVRRQSGRVLLVRANPMPEGGWVCVFTDITAERNVTAALAESEDRYRRLIETSPDMVAVQRAGRFVFVNAAGARMLGARTPLDVVGRRVLDFIHPDDHDRARHGYTIHADADVVSFTEMRGRKLDGMSFDLEAASFDFTYQGHPATLVFVRDITERKMAQAQLVQTSKLALLGEMAASIAHELNQPLNIIRMAADASLILMEEGRDDPENHRLEFERISSQTERMAAIINHMRVFSRRDDDSGTLFDPIACVEGAISLVRDQYRLDGVEIREVLPPRTASVRGQPIRLEQVILNLLANARDAVSAPRAGGAIEVSAFLADEPGDGRARRDGGEVVIVVSDDGGGIPADNLHRIFDPFFTTKQVGKGTGLGLAIGYSIVTAMQGTISAANGPRGAVFEIRLPVSAGAQAGRVAPRSREAAES